MNPVVSHLIAGVGCAGSMLIFVITNFDNVERMYARVTGFLARYTARAEKAAVAADIQSRVNLAFRSSGSALIEAIPYKLKVEWMTSSTREAIIAGNEVIIKLDYHRKNQNRNFALTVTDYISKGLLPHARAYVETAIVQATELVLVWNILASVNKDALDYFFEDILRPALGLNSETKDWYDILAEIDRRGLLIPILLPELVDFGRLLYPAPPTASMQREAANFVKFLERIAKRERGDEETPLSFTASWIQTAVILVAKAATVESSGIEAYCAHADKCISRGSKTIYFCAVDYNIRYVKQLADMYSEDPRVSNIDRFMCKVHLSGSRRAMFVRLEMKRRTSETLAAMIEAPVSTG